MFDDKQKVEMTAGQSSVSKAARWEDNERVIRALLALWTGVPYMRFGQLVMNLSRIEGGFADTWEWSNATWVQRIEDGMGTWAKVPALDTRDCQQSRPTDSEVQGFCSEKLDVGGLG